MTKYPQVRALFEGFGGTRKLDRTAARRALALSAGVSDATVSRWITGQSRPDVESWAAIGDALGMSAREVGQHLVPDDGTIPSSGLNEDQAQLADHVSATMTKLDRRVEALEKAVAEVRDLIARGTLSRRVGE